MKIKHLPKFKFSLSLNSTIYFLIELFESNEIHFPKIYVDSNESNDNNQHFNWDGNKFIEDQSYLVEYPLLNSDDVYNYMIGKITIRGYTTPHDLFGNLVLKDTMYIPDDKIPNLHRIYNSDKVPLYKDKDKQDLFSLPSELVRTWKPIFGEKESITLKFIVNSKGFIVKVTSGIVVEYEGKRWVYISDKIFRDTYNSIVAAELTNTTRNGKVSFDLITIDEMQYTPNILKEILHNYNLYNENN